MYTPDQIADIIREVRIWFEDSFGRIGSEIGDWKTPNFPYNINEMLWHIAESDWFAKEHIVLGHLEAKYQPYTPEKDFSYYKAEYLSQNKALEEAVRKITSEQINAEMEFPGADGVGRDHPLMPMWRQILRLNFHTVHHIATCKIIRGVKGRLDGESQKWPPY